MKEHANSLGGIMIHFESDYMSGTHPKILEKIIQTNDEEHPGYGTDVHCEKARSLIKKHLGDADCDVHFLVGGTQTNRTILSAILRPHQGAISCDTGHINVHETGAIEASGHKVLTIPGVEGKMQVKDLKEYMAEYDATSHKEHMVQPKVVYLSQSTELGTVYTKAEMEAFREICDQYGLYLMVDGARLGYALECEGNDLTLSHLAKLTDVFYIGATKVSAMFGEAVVIAREELKEDFRYHIKQNGGMLAKGRYLGIQFETLFEDDLYFEVSRHALTLAIELKKGLKELGIPFFTDSPTNQQFILLTEKQWHNASLKYIFDDNGLNGDLRIARICTTWSTKPEQIRQLLEDAKTW